jgi:hypothetical protein
VKTTVTLDAETHTKLVAAAALRGMDRSTVAAGFIRDGVKTVIVFDKAMDSVQGDSKDRPDVSAQTRNPGDKAA